MTRLRITGFFLIALLAMSSLCQAVSASGEVEYGGPFELLDHNGRTVTNRDFLGNYMLIYFGYTYCPDICPTSLARMVDALRQMGDRANAIQPIFVSVDSLRDTPERLALYVKAFDERLIGLTGDSDAISAAARAYWVQYFAGMLEGEYVVGHTGYLYLVGPDGDFIEKIPDSISPQELAAKLLNHLDQADG